MIDFFGYFLGGEGSGNPNLFHHILYNLVIVRLYTDNQLSSLQVPQKFVSWVEQKTKNVNFLVFL